MEFLPANTTSIIQPCDQGIIRNLKCYYRREVIKKIIADIDDTSLTANELAKTLTLLDAVHLLTKAWQSVKSVTIANCYRKAGFVDSAPVPADDSDDTVPPPPGMDASQFEAYVSHDDDTECHSTPSDEDICLEFMTEDRRAGDSDSDDDELPVIKLPILSMDVKNALSTIRSYLEENNCASFQEFYAVEELCQKTMCESKKQTKITEFLNWIP